MKHPLVIITIFVLIISMCIWAVKKQYSFEGSRTAQLVSYSHTDFGWRLRVSVYRPEKSQSMTYFALYGGNDSSLLKYFTKKSYKSTDIMPAISIPVEYQEGPLSLNCVEIK